VQPLSLFDRVTKMPRQLTALKVGTSFGEILVVKGGKRRNNATGARPRRS
jgi:hypothetical protein